MLGYGMRKANKADFVLAIKKHLKDEFIEVDELPPSNLKTCLVVDAMAFVQRYQNLGCQKFGEVTNKYLRKVISLKPVGCDGIHFIGDRYDVSPTESLKGEEREKRQKIKSREYLLADALLVPEWKIFIQNGNNKSSLLDYIGESWIQNMALLPPGVSITLGGVFKHPGRAVLINSLEMKEIPELSCTQHEEADTRIFSHIAFSVEHGYKRAIIEATDTDIFIMSMYYSKKFLELH